MKTKFKTAFKIIAVLAIIAVICILLLLIPGAIKKLGEWTGISTAKITNTLVTVAGVAIGGVLISFGVTALAAVPIVGIALIVIGLAIGGWCLYTSGWFSNSGGIPIDDKTKLQKVA